MSQSFRKHTFHRALFMLPAALLIFQAHLAAQGRRPDPLQATQLQAKFRGGQTFITWRDADSANVKRYRILRHNSPITDDNSTQAEVLADWVASGSGIDYVSRAIFKNESGFVIRDLGEQLALGMGLYVHTVSQQEAAYYAVGSLDSTGKLLSAFESGKNSLAAPVEESPGSFQPVLIEKLKTETGWADIYNHWVDRDMHPREGMAYRFAVALPENYRPEARHPLLIALHGAGGSYGTMFIAEPDWVVLYPDMRTVTFRNEKTHEWDGNGSNFWFGLNSNFYNREDPYGGINVNYDERRLLWTIRRVMERYNVDPDRVHVQGGSMGGYASLNMALHYPELFASAYAWVPPTDFFRMSDYGNGIATMHWGPREANIRTNEGTGIFDRTDLVAYARSHPEVDFPVIMMFNGKQDKLITWEGPRLFYQAMQQSNHALLAFWSRGEHTGGPQQAKFGTPWQYFATDLRKLRRDQSYPALDFASNNDLPGTSSDNGDPAGQLNASFQWRDIVDRLREYEGTIEPLNGRALSATADLTPRRLQRFEILPDKKYSYRNIELKTGKVIQSGVLRPDKYKLITIKAFQIGEGGNRLQIAPLD